MSKGMFGAVRTPIGTVAEANKQDRGLEHAKTELSIQEWGGLEFSAPNPLGQPLRHGVWCGWTTFAAPGGFCSHYTGESFVYTLFLINISLSLSDDANKIKPLNIERA